ncbi:hypothetical protein ACRQ84_06165 [Enterobacter ludwigii]
MAGNRIDAATLVNRVTYQTDIAALRRVRKQIRDLKKKFNESDEKTHKDALKRTRLESAARIREARREARELRRLGANRGPGGNRGGSGGGSRSGGRSEAEREAARQRKEQERQQAKQRRDEERRVRQQGTRNERADLMRRSRGFDITRMQGLNAEQRHNGIREAHRISEEYRNQTISLQQANEALRQQRRQLESIARQQRQANRRAGVPQPRHSRLAAGLAATGAVGAIGYGAERLTGAARETLAGSIERNAGRQQLNTQGVSTIEADALINQVRARTGRTLTYEQLSDQAKDYREKTGELSLGKWNQAKDGSWSLGSAGEMADLVNAVTQRGGKAAGQQVQQNLQNMSFTDYLVYLRQLQKQFKFTDQQMTFFAETVNDGSLALGGIDQTGKNLDDTMMQIARSGQSLTDEQSKNLTYLANLGSVAQSASDNLGDSFSSAFAGRMKELGIGADETRQSFAELKPIMRELGETVGEITAWVSKHLGMIPGSASYNSETYKQSYQAALDHKDDNPLEQFAYKRWNSTSTAGEAGWNDAMAGKAMDQNFIGADVGNNFTPQAVNQSNYDSLMNRSNPFNLQLPPINQNLSTDVHVHVDGAQLMKLFNGVADQRIENSWDSMTFDINQMTFNN